MSRAADMPVYQTKETEIAARLYNLWRRDRLHSHGPLRFSLTGYRGLVMLLDDDEWLCADETQYDLPVICWNAFQSQGREALHLPIKCTLNYYHFAAGKIRQPVLELLEQELEKRLSGDRPKSFFDSHR